MLFLGHLDDMHGVDLLWEVTLWGLFLNSQNHCKSYWYWVIALWIHWKKKENNSACICFVNISLQMTIAGRYELENTLGSQNEALPSQIYHLINNILENECFTHVYLILCLDASTEITLGRLQTTLCNNDTHNAVILECFNVQSSFWALMKGYT